MDLKQLRMLQILDRVGSLSAAAEELSTSQPRLTQQLRQVEQELGTTLFHRSPKGLMLSDSGRAFLPYARRINTMFEAAHTAVSKVGDATSRKLRLGISITASMQLVPANLLAFHKAYPEIYVSICRSTPEQLLRGLEEGRFDLCLGLELPESPLFVRREVFSTRMVGLSLNSMAMPRTITLEKFAQNPLVLPPRSCGARVLVDDALRRAKVRPRILMEIDDTGTILSIVKAGAAATILPQIIPGLSSRLQVSEFPNFSGEVKGTYLHPRRITPEAEAFIRLSTQRMRSHTDWDIPDGA